MKVGIVFEGGASRTVFSSGVMDALLEAGIEADYVLGVSAGIAYGISYVAKQPGRNIKIATEYMNDKRYMGWRHLFLPENKSYYNMKFVFEDMANKHVPFDYEAFREFKGEVKACVTNIRTGEAEYLDVPRDDKAFQVVKASCALPLFFQPVKVGKKYYLDGGIADSIPYRQALLDGCDKLIVVLTRERNYSKGSEKGLKLSQKIYHKFPEVVRALENRQDCYNQTLKELARLEAEERIFIIAPNSMSGFKRTEANPEILQKLYDQGYEKTKNAMEALQNYLKS